MRKSLLSIAIILFVFILAGCKKDSNYLVADAIIKDAGLPAADGCGWLIQTVADDWFQAENLPEKFKVNNLQIHMTYTLTGKRYTCGWVAPTPQNPGSPVINIHSIEKQ
ncbi:hypothetical protein MUY27_04340 [Mucilaginibacter sp. RS28]|uniref:Lipoprotein n=1 Tax=Mucilaginibacter straminoryzae TaxID=2932774 RepID=A0A9X1X224_9SPHI|nr:hypothetical protein [Mucilaginibacter straminoryzae]MCJ8208925.1 hypothetical protein [Mucilaginibacter straminoryzae]